MHECSSVLTSLSDDEKKRHLKENLKFPAGHHPSFVQRSFDYCSPLAEEVDN
uniref:Uncharacterized protein n=1 Tax=Rhizophora mucronata TaxID=61149 RepID=A0A2P2NE48_RHIMU